MILIICNTSYQVFNAINMKLQMHADDDVDIILSEHSDIQKLQKNLEDSGLFRHVYLAESLELARRFYFYEDDTKLTVLLNPKNSISKCLDIDYLIYDIIYTANVDGYINLIYRLHRINNSDCEFRYYEDGWSTYTNDWSNFAYSPYEKYFFEILGQPIFQKNIKEIYVYEPLLGCFTDKFEYKKIPKIDINNNHYRNVYNSIFDYKESDEYKRATIFLEEAFEQDGYQNNDYQLVQHIVNVVGKDNLVVKRHPRLLKNRYIDDGICTNTDFSVPWEVIIMNNNFSNKILFTITSGAVLTPRLVFDIPVFSVYMRDLLQGSVSRMYKTKEFKNFVGMFRKRYPNELYIPKTIGGINTCMDAILEEMQVHEWVYRINNDEL